ncbi:DUF1800 domain-containing protein [Microscilla marina]|uniref:DUF1800 domain-containing protein n=1 Tax=Microscilla marina ATCC 23134 TaxID=313606 RepID=A1ZT70_MICM2|nr:DUF1800 family protein [Microscilla marina]EAY26460.1 conserved protein of unknown function [Microscilla marina ATCC 23134]
MSLVQTQKDNLYPAVPLKDASRFLAQATLGYHSEDIKDVAQQGYKTWLDKQLALPRKSVLEVGEELKTYFSKNVDDPPGVFRFRAVWWNLVLGQPDLVRQRVTYALSQIFVVSAFANDFFTDEPLVSNAYYEVLSKHTYGNYRDLLVAVSRSTSMGMYLSHLYNPKGDKAKNIHPDENYAREVMQLFSIGLYELNNDGTRKKDAKGEFIPTYDNATIREFAKIFTGFGCDCPTAKWLFPVDDFEGEERHKALLNPMKMYDEWHESGTKKLLRGKVIPAGQTGMKDFNDAIDNLFYHPNVGPFIGKALIQLLTSANPGPAYVNRVANAFNNNGQGVRGDMKAVIRAILLDPEIRKTGAENNPKGGKLREPLLRYTGFLKAFKAEASRGVFINHLVRWEESIGQAPLYAQSVFNFYLPNYQPNGAIADQQLVAPVFQIHNSSTSIGYINEVSDWCFENSPFGDDEDDRQGVQRRVKMKLDFEEENELLAKPKELIAHLDILLACGQLSTQAKKVMTTAVAKTPEDQRLNMALFLVMIAPEYAVLK